MNKYIISENNFNASKKITNTLQEFTQNRIEKINFLQKINF